MRKEFKKETWNITQNSITRQANYKGKYYFEKFYDRNKKKPWFHKKNFSRYFVTMINRIRANHFNLNESLARKNYIEDTRCECGGESESLEHVLWQCSRYDEERIKMDAELRKRGILGNIDVTRTIKNSDWVTKY